MYKRKRIQPQDDQWPPDQPKVIVNLALIHLEGKKTQQEFIEIPAHSISPLHSHNSRITKNISEIFSWSKKCILIEGAPGIGKTVLAKEIAYSWASDQLLLGMKLFLLFTRDPKLHPVESIDDLLHYLGDNYLSKCKVEAASARLKEIKGSNVVFVIDGYDECPQNCNLKRFIDQLYNHEFLPECTVVITSRPTASLSLRGSVGQRIEILGLTKKEQDKYITESLKDSPKLIPKLQDYLKHQPIINSLIYVPLHLAILLYLFKQRWLPETLTEMNEYFIMHTIYRHLKKVKKQEIQFNKLHKITDLPEAELTVICQLSKLAYEGLCDRQLIFTYDEIKRVCPKLNDIPGAINGFGLLQTQSEECYYQKPGVGKTISLNFLHLTMQEYLAALHVSMLPNEQQSILMNFLFFNDRFNFMWIMYMGIMKSQSHCFTEIVSFICHRQEPNKLAILFIFQCFLERKELITDDFNRIITAVFSDGNIDLSNIILLPHQVMSLIIFMMKSFTKWKSLNLSSCFFINCEGFTSLIKFFTDFKEKLSTIQHINLSNNHITSLSKAHIDIDMAEAALLSVESLDLSCNKLNDNEAKKLFSALDFNKKLRKLNLSKNDVSDDAAVVISNCLMSNEILNDLDLSVNNITDEGAKRIADAIRVNKTLWELNISKNLISKEGIMKIVEACTQNRTLHKLVCTHNNLSKSGFAAINEYIRKENAVQLFDASWNSISIKDGELVIKTAFQLLDVKQKLQSDSNNANNVQDELWYMNRVSWHKTILQNCFEEYFKHQSVSLDVYLDDFVIETLCDCLRLNNSVVDLNLSNDYILLIPLHKISEQGILFIRDCLIINKTLCSINLSGNDITDSGVKTLAEAITVNETLQILNLARNNIADEGARSLAQSIQKNKILQELDISKNWISKEGIMRIVEACRKNRTIHKLVCTHNNLSRSGLTTINEYIEKENAIQIFDASWNSIHIDGRLDIITTFQLLDLQQKLQSGNKCQKESWSINKIGELEVKKEFLRCCFEGEQSIKLQGIKHWCLESKQGVNVHDQGFWISGKKNRTKSTSNTANDDDDIDIDNFVIEVISDFIKHKTLTEFTLSDCKITDKEIQTLAEAIEVNTTLQSVDISYNKINDKGILFICNCLNKVNRSLCKLNLSGNQITDDGVKIFMEAVTVNKILRELNLSGNNITDKAANSFAEAIHVNTTLRILNISKNWISKDGVMRILEACTKNKTLHKLVCTHNNLLQYELAAINGYIRKKKAIQIFHASWNSIDAASWNSTQTKNHKVTIKTTFHLLDLQQELQSGNYNIHQNTYEPWCMDQIADLNYKRQILHSCFQDYLNKQCISLQDVQMKDFEVEVFSDCLKLNDTITDLNLSGCLVTNNIGLVLSIIGYLKNNNTLCRLNLSNNHISDTVVEALAEIVMTNTTLQRFNLSHNDISDYGILFICDCLQINNTLCELDLSKNNITNEGAKRLALGIQINTTLQELNISRNWISKKGIMRIVEACTKNRKLHKLVCTHNNLSKSELAIVNEYIKKQSAVQIFVASWNGIDTKDGELVVTVTCQLLDEKQNMHDHIFKELWYVGEITEQYRREFLCCCLESEQNVNLQNIKKIYIEFFSDCFKMNNTLLEINLSNNNITDKGIEKLAEAIRVNTTLQNLDISCNAICNGGIVVLSNCLMVNNVLRKLNISKNDISDDGANHLAKTIQINTALQELNISKNLISKDGVMKIVEACAKNKVLYKLVCTHNNLSKSGLASINEHIRKDNALQIFDASWNSISIKSNRLAIKTTLHLLDVSQNNFQLHNNNSNIQENLWYVNKITELEYRRNFLLCCFESEQKVNLQGIRMTDYFEIEIISDSLKVNNTLIELNLSNNKITDEDAQKIFEAIQMNEALENLDISQNEIAHDGTLAICNCLMNNFTLCKLNLSKNHITDDEAKVLAEAIRESISLQELNVCNNWISKEGVMIMVEACTINRTLHHLVCTGNNMSKSGLASINQFIRKENAVQKFYASWNSICTINNKLNIKTTFQLLDVKQEMQSDDDNFQQELWCLDEITELKYRKELLRCCFEEHLNKETFSLHSTRMTDFEVEILSDCFQNNFTLVEINFSNCFTDDNITAILAISNCLKNNSTLQKLNLSNNQITDSGMKTLTEAIATNTVLQNIDISCNLITDNGIVFISSFLKTNRTLCILYLSGNQITDNGLKTLADSLTDNITLQRLDISCNTITDDGISFISDSLKLNKALHELIISGNNITDEGAKLLAEAIQINTVLQELNISKNWISKDGIIRIVEACIKNKTLQKLVCTHNNLSKSGLNMINDYLRKENAVNFLFNASWNSIYTKNSRLGIKTCLHVDWADEDIDDVQYYVNINIPVYKNLLLHCCLEEYLNKQIVNLQDVEINDGEIKVLSHCLEINTVLVDLNMSNYNKSANAKLDDILAISQCLKINITLSKLNLSRNYITDEGAKLLAEAIRVNTTLKMLNVSNNMMFEGVMRIVEACTESKTLHELACSHNMLLKHQLFTISEYIKREKVLQRFEASWNSICINNGRLGIETTLQILQRGDDSVYKESHYVGGITETEDYRLEFTQCFTEYLNVKSISLQNIMIKDFEVISLFYCLTANKAITELILSNCSCAHAMTFTFELIVQLISDYLKTKCTLCILNLSNNQIADDEIKILAEAVSMNTTLKRFDLFCNKISDKGVWFFSNHLKNNKTLRIVNLYGNNITDRGTFGLAKAIQENTTLLELDISKNRISKEGVMRILDACTRHRTLQKLVCTHNNLSKSGLAAISEYNKKENAVQIFDASWNSICTTKHKLAIETTLSGNIQKELWYVDEISELWYRTELLQCYLEEHLNDHCVNLQDNRVNNFQVEILSDCLKINNTLIDLNLLEYVKINSWLTCNYNIATVNINTKLQKLELSHTISDDKILFLSYCLETNRTLHELNLSKNNITNEGVKKLAEAIQMNTTLQELDISKNWIGKEGVMMILEACTKNRTLYKLVCRHNNLSKSGLAAINEYIRKENALEVFDASWNGLSVDNKIVIKTNFQVLDVKQSQDDKADSVQQKFSMQSILWHVDENLELKCKREFLYCCFEEFFNKHCVSLQNTQMNDFEVEILGDCLKSNKILSELNLSSSLISNDHCLPLKTISTISNCLQINDTLCVLNFSNNHITDDAVKVLIEAIATNLTLQKVNLSHNIISDSGISFFNNYLKINKKLHELNLSGNNITHIGTRSLAEGIQENTTLLELNVSKNLINKEGIMRIVEACVKNRTLHKLVCTHNNLSKFGLAAIIEYIRKENAVQIFVASWNNIDTKFGKMVIKPTLMVIKPTLKLFNVNKQLEDGNINIQEEMWCLNEITKLEHRRKFLHCCFESGQSVNLQGIGMADCFEIELISDCLRVNKTLTELTISKAKITDKEVEKFIKAIEVNITLQSVDISHNIITENGILIIINSLKNNRVLRKLNLSKNNITDEGAKRIAEAIQVNKTLRELNISKNLISKEGVMEIVEACTQNRTLHKLVCTHNNLSKSGLAAINEYIVKENAIQIFDASWNSMGTKYGVLVIITTFQLQDKKNSLDKIEKAESWHVNEITNVEYRRKFLCCCFEGEQRINLQGICVTDYFEIITDCLKMNKILIELNLSNSSIDKGAETLVEAIKVNTILQNLDISCNRIYCSGIVALSDCLKVNKVLTKLNLSENNIGNRGAKYLDEFIQINTTLLELNISKNQISKGGIMRIVKACTNNRTLNKLVCRCNNLSKSELAAINEYIRAENAVRTFDASWSSTIANYDYSEQLLIIVVFQTLALSTNGDWETIFSKESEMCLVSNHGKLDSRSIQYHFTHDSLKELRFLPSIMSTNVLLHFMQKIIQIDTLQKFSISGNKISDDGAITFAKSFKANTKLIELDMSGNNISCNGARAIAEVIRVNDTLQKLDISHNEICSDGAIALSECLKTNSTLVDLNVSWNIITCKGANAFGEAMEVNIALQKLDISDNKISDDGAIALSEHLKTNVTLIELKMSGNNITLKGISAIAEAMEVNNTLQKLDISNSKISDNGIIAFSKYLKMNIPLTELDISSNNITCRGAIAIAEVMQMSTTLQKLNISNNIISDTGLVAFSEFLETNTTLTELNMSSNSITCKGASVVAEIMRMNTTLQKLDISANEISDDGATAFSKCLKTNATLTEFNISRDYFTRKGANVIAEAIQTNTSLRSLTLCSAGMKALSCEHARSFNMTILTALYHNDKITELTISMPFSLVHDTALLDEFEKINNKRRKQDIDLVKFNCIDEYY